MKTDKTKLLQDIEAMKEKLASMEEELNKPEVFKHFPSKGDEYYYYDTTGLYVKMVEDSNILRVNVYKTLEEADKAYNKAVALEKVKRRLLELQGDWKPDWKVDSYKHLIFYNSNHNFNKFEVDVWARTKYPTLIPYMKNEEIAVTIIEEMEDELKLIFDIA